VISETGLILDDVFNVASDNEYKARYHAGKISFGYVEISSASGSLNYGSSV
jgi:hypothetical protein